MASQFKIPKKKLSSDFDSAHTHLQSPLSYLQGPAPQDYGTQSGRRGADRVHAGNAAGWSTDRRRDQVKTLLGLNSPDRGGASAANHRAPGSWRSQPQSGQRRRATASTSNGWRPKRASDRLLGAEHPSPPPKKSVDPSDSSTGSVSVVTVDSLAELRGEVHAGSLVARTQRTRQNDAEGENHNSSEDDFLSPTKTFVHRPPISSVWRRSLDRPAWTSTSTSTGTSQKEDGTREDRDRKSDPQPRLNKQTPAEPILLSSEEDEEEEDVMTSQSSSSSRQEEESRLPLAPQTLARRPEGGHDRPPPPFLQLEFSSLHAGLTHAHAHGKMMINENGLMIPVKVSGGEEGDVVVVASQLNGYGVWDGGVAQGGDLLDGWEGPAPSLLFLWVTDAQANLLQRELSALRGSPAPSGVSCSFLLLVLTEQLQQLQVALLASILDMEEYQKGRSSSSSSSSPLDWTDGLLLLHTCPPPLDQHLLSLLGHWSSGQQQQPLPARLIQYPAAPCRGRITVNKEDLACLDAGQFLNDVIIDFYLKFLLLEGGGGCVAERSHVFSSFFFKQLSRRRAPGEDDAPSLPDRHMRHRRVKTWTRHMDIFRKDYLFVPVNQESHWFLVVVCFPGLEDVQYQECHSSTGSSERTTGKGGLRPPPPECTDLGRHRDTVMKRPCILVMDSLKLTDHEDVCRLIRGYLQVEWDVRMKTRRLFSRDSMRSSSCRVPQQDNSSDCGVYLLQYVHSFLQNPVVHFDLPLRLDGWFPRQQVRQKREEIRNVILRLHRNKSQ
ncbi:sentrin-specific protease 7b isoform X1 [Scophthalmus maximus]|uniref:sentrin-specific protease 7b isoform X1 n=1 Tax=Scophthalmus maximus TaxID=52904 RepID=UPI0015E0DD5E|nr:sentrin-specific protease 7b isoform X1 [Scophthalmus maximus]XP_035490373.1 sentrin-specific protease 7b isoform X1 [Scophthalmus maximus]